MTGFLPLLATLLLRAPAPRPSPGPQIDAEEYARVLVDNPIFARGDWQTAIESALELLHQEPSHPLAAANLALLADRLDDAPDTREIATRLLALTELAGFDVAARRELDQLRAWALAVLGSAEPGVDLYPDYLAQFLALGPLPPHFAALPGRLAPPELRSPDFEATARGLHGDIAWTPCARLPLQRLLGFHEALGQGQGHALLAAPFEDRDGGPAWIEIEARFPMESLRPGAGFPGVVPSYACSVNGAAPWVTEHLGREIGAIHREPVVLRRGVNQVVLWASLQRSARPLLAVRILNPDGSPRAVAAAAQPGALGAVVTAEPPQQFPADSISWLLGQGERGADTEALLGLLLERRGLEIQSLEHLRSALQLAPERVDLKSHLSAALQRASHLPQVTRRGEARQLAESAVRADPPHYRMRRFLADLLAAEDREEEAVAELEEVAGAAPQGVGPLLRLRELYQELGLQAEAEKALERALQRAPGNPRVLSQYAGFLAQTGRRRAAAEVAEAAATCSGRGGDLVAAAERRTQLGEVERATELLRAATRHSRGFFDSLIRHLLDSGQWEQAEAVIRELQSESPLREDLALAHAEVALRRGDKRTQEAQLRQALRLNPLRHSTRERLAELAGGDRIEEFLRGELQDVAEIIAAYDGRAYQESVVSVLDHSVMYFFPDGSSESLTQNLYQVRDLKGCEEMGTLQLPGEVLSAVTLKPDGTRFEPILVGGEYVMPALQPGDFVEAVYRMRIPAPVDGVVPSIGWFFASVDKAFHISRYVLSLPDSLGLKLDSRRLEGIEHAEESLDGRTVHRWVARGMQRVLPEPGAPPRTWFLPMVDVGHDDSVPTIARFLLAEERWYTWVTPEIRAAAERETRGAIGQEAQARALYDFVNRLLDQRGFQPAFATHTLLGRQGNPAFLYLSLLRAAGIPGELIWSRGVAPESDDQPDPAYVTMDRWRRQPLVRVHPAAGPEAWCDLSVPLLPYGTLSGMAPGAEALAVETGELLATPSRPLSERPSVALEGTLTLRPDGSAEVRGRAELRGGIGFTIKQQVEGIPEASRLFAIRQYASQIIPGLQVEEFELPGLDRSDQPLQITLVGAVRSFLDRNGDELVCASPLPAKNLSARFSGEGRRRLPYFLRTPLLDHVRIRLELPAELELTDAPPPLDVEPPGGGRYQIRVEQESDRVWVLERRVEIDARVIPPDAYPQMLEFCRQVDRAESVRLRFRARE